MSVSTVVSGDTLSEHSVLLARGWLTECCQSHLACNDTTLTAAWFPTRLLHIKEIPNKQYHVRLVNTARERPSGPYATLSHRWGQADYLQLTRDTSPVFSEAIPMLKLSKTFQDAISITSRLGIDYLWIDSLCIMQDKDDLSDWLHEASLMDKVYRYSHCNISASVSLDGSQGLCRKRNLANLYPPTVRLLKQGSGTNLEDYHEAYQLRNEFLWEYNVTKSQIHTRGWVFQEMLLAPRVLHFSHDQLFWECRQHRACEVYPNGNSVLDFFGGISEFKSYLQEHAMASKSALSNSAIDGKRDMVKNHEVWHEMVHDYSRTNLTNPHDKLIALSGIAKLMSTFIQGTYIAGMWRENFERDLLWFKMDIQDEEDTPKYPASLYRAPTWSWASRDRRIQFPQMQGAILYSVRDVFVQHTTQDVTGHITSGWLEVAGKLGPITLSFGKGRKPFENHTLWRIDNDSCT